MFEEALQASVVRVDVGGTWEGGGEPSQIDGFDPEQSDDEGGQTGDASPVQTKGGLEQVGESGRVLHGCNLLRPLVVVDRLSRPSTIGGYTLSFNYLTTFVVYSAQAETLDRSQNVVRRLGLAKRLRVGIDSGNVVRNGCFEFLGAAMHATPKLLVGRQGKETLRLIQPGSPGRRELNVPEWMTSGGVSSRVRRTTSVMSSSLMRLGVMGRGSSLRPSS